MQAVLAARIDRLPPEEKGLLHKEDVLELVRQLPDEIDVEEVIYRLYLREKLAAAEADIAAGRTLSPEEVREQTRTWRQ